MNFKVRVAQHKIMKAKSPECKTCKVEDTTEHIINTCRRHEETREIMLAKLKFCGKVTELLKTTEPEKIKQIANFLTEIEDQRIEQDKKEKEEETNKTTKKLPAKKKPKMKPARTTKKVKTKPIQRTKAAPHCM